MVSNGCKNSLSVVLIESTSMNGKCYQASGSKSCDRSSKLSVEMFCLPLGRQYAMEIAGVKLS